MLNISWIKVSWDKKLILLEKLTGKVLEKSSTILKGVEI